MVTFGSMCLADTSGEEVLPESEGKKLKEVLLEPTVIWRQGCLAAYQRRVVNGIAQHHRWWLYRNVPRMFADDLLAEIGMKVKVPALPIFKALGKE